jgi:hypothetical protein
MISALPPSPISVSVVPDTLCYLQFFVMLFPSSHTLAGVSLSKGNVSYPVFKLTDFNLSLYLNLPFKVSPDLTIELTAYSSTHPSTVLII